MSSKEVIYEKNHFRHDPRWSGRLGPAEGGGLLLCVACVLDMLERDDCSSARKSYALSAISGVLKCSPGALRELLQQDHQVSMQFITSLLGMLHTTLDSATLEKVDQVLVLLLLELQSELPLRFVLDQIDKKVIDQLNVKSFLPTFNFLGSLVEAVPGVAISLVTQYAPLLDRLCSVLLYPDEGLKASIIYVWLKTLGAAGGSPAHALPVTLRDRVCVLLLQTFANASSPQLINNCIALLWLLVQWGEAVSVLMSNTGIQFMTSQTQTIHISSQDQEQQTSDHCHLPLILKKLLLSGEEALHVTSAKCIASILVHSPSHYSASFIKADVPEFLFDRLVSTSSELLLWSLYSCLLLLVEDPLFFSQCHSVYGIESLVRSLKQALQLTNMDVLKQGFVLLTEILGRQPPNVRLFLSAEGFLAVSQTVVAGLSSPCLRVATQVASAASALFRLHHQSRPVQYKELQELVAAITHRLNELPLPSSAQRQSIGRLKKSDQRNLASRSEGFLLQSMLCLQTACRLAEECASDPVLMENTFTAPSEQSRGQDSLESLCQCLLRCCDSVWIPSVVRMCECAPNPQILQAFYSVLCSQFTLLPSLMPVFATKMASSGFYRLALEHKGILCVGNRNTSLNAACCGFLQKLSMCLFSQSSPSCTARQQDVEEVENLLQYNLPSLCCSISDWPSLLREYPGQLPCDEKGPRATQYCLVIILHLALQQGDRLLPDQTVFSSVVWLLRSVQEDGNCTVPTSVLRSALYLLAVTQDNGITLEGAPLKCISMALSSCQSFSSLYSHHPALLHFICSHPLLEKTFGGLILELWLTKQAQYTDADLTMRDTHVKDKLQRGDGETEKDIVELLSVIKKYPAIILTLLDMVCTRESSLAERALSVLTLLLDGNNDFEADLCASLKMALLQVLQKISVQTMDRGHHAKEAVSMLLSNGGLMERLQTVLSSSSSSSALLCVSHLLLSSLITLQHVHASQVHKSLSWSLDRSVQRILIQKRNTDNLLLVSYLRLLEALLNVDLTSALMRVSTAPGLLGHTPLEVEDGQLFPLGSRGAQCLAIALSGLILQKHELLLRASVNCLTSLLGFLHRRSPKTAKYVVCQPWSRFLLSCLHSSGESCLLHPAILRLLTLLMRHGSTVVRWEPDLLRVIDAVERKGVKTLSQEASHTLRLLLTQIQSGVWQPPPTEEHKQRVRRAMDSLDSEPASESPVVPSNILRVGALSICLSHFTLILD
ncbi:meiosis inhibitor protein 1-like isoform X5 [Entelurus aequoreus]|uniref:meiosis inhibitor protein 1-like isoform X5 n=1 Tax=Entelurus aequoreus TaxID=161455 RepID=UPI002B1D61A6|nr:meiosis inhibitor protein 1-like isoform X5 [Entelurus aequoreus]